MFSMILQNSAVADIIAMLSKTISDLPLEITNDSLDIATMNDERHMAIWLHIHDDDLVNLEFEGEEMERYVISSEMFAKAVKNLGYPIEISSIMDGSIKINSQNGRQSYKIKPVTDRSSENGEYYRRRFQEAMNGTGFTLVTLQKQDFREAIKTVKVAGGRVHITLDDTALIFSTPSIEIDAEAVAPLIESVGDIHWEHDYNVDLLDFVLRISTVNTPVKVYLYDGDDDSIVVHMMLSEHSFCVLRIAAVSEREHTELETGSV